MSAGVAAQDVEAVNGEDLFQEDANYGGQSEVVAPLHTEGIEQSIDEIENDFPGIRIAVQLEDKGQKAGEEETKEATLSPPEDQQEVQRQPPPPQQQHPLAKSEYIPTKSTNPILVEAAEYHDNEFWNIKKSQL